MNITHTNELNPYLASIAILTATMLYESGAARVEVQSYSPARCRALELSAPPPALFKAASAALASNTSEGI